MEQNHQAALPNRNQKVRFAAGFMIGFYIAAKQRPAGNERHTVLALAGLSVILSLGRGGDAAKQGAAIGCFAAAVLGIVMQRLQAEAEAATSTFSPSPGRY